MPTHQCREPVDWWVMLHRYAALLEATEGRTGEFRRRSAFSLPHLYAILEIIKT